MTKQKLVRALKIVVIVFLALAILLIAFLQFKSDFIVRKVLTIVQSQLADSLQYQDARLDMFSHFPSVAVELDQLKIGSGKTAFIDGATVDIAVRLFPLFKDAIDIQNIEVADATIQLLFQNGKWTYDILKKTEGVRGETWSTLVREISITNTLLKYRDGANDAWEIQVANASGKGKIDASLVDIELDCDGVLMVFSSGSYKLPEPVNLQFEGGYMYDVAKSIQQFNKWKINHDAVQIVGEGAIEKTESGERYDIKGEWSDAKPGLLLKWLPEKNKEALKDYEFDGKGNGKLAISGLSTKTQSPNFMIEGIWEDGGFSSPKMSEPVKNMDVDFVFHSANPEHKSKSTLHCTVEKKSTFGNDFRAIAKIINLDQPVADLDIKGNMPGALLNLLAAPTFTIQEGTIDIESFSLNNLSLSGDVFRDFLNKANWSLKTKDVKCDYATNPISWTDGQLEGNAGKGMQFEFDQLTWDKATANDFKGEVRPSGQQVQFSFGGKFCEGQIESSGTFATEDRKVFKADWKVKNIAIEQLFASFSNFDQTFITDANLSGKANAWAETIIPMDANWKIKSKEVIAKSAIEIHDGRLKNLKTLEDFSDYVHIEDLKDIRFNELRNYLKIEDGKVYLPVMFLQSSAMNMSISGVHGFDQRILYNMKINAGQAIANKIKKNDFRKEFKSARKSGWINMYFVLEGTTSDVKYQQYRLAVLAGFEQSAQIKESLRNYLVEKFGYEVYWLEPNEWEDIPEYK